MCISAWFASAWLLVSAGAVCTPSDVTYISNVLSLSDTSFETIDNLASWQDCMLRCNAAPACQRWTHFSKRIVLGGITAKKDQCKLYDQVGTEHNAGGNALSGPPCYSCIIEEWDMAGNDLHAFVNVGSAEACRDQCAAHSGCTYFVHEPSKNKCYVKGGTPDPGFADSRFSAGRLCVGTTSTTTSATPAPSTQEVTSPPGTTMAIDEPSTPAESISTAGGADGGTTAEVVTSGGSTSSRELQGTTGDATTAEGQTSTTGPEQTMTIEATSLAVTSTNGPEAATTNIAAAVTSVNGLKVTTAEAATSARPAASTAPEGTTAASTVHSTTAVQRPTSTSEAATSSQRPAAVDRSSTNEAAVSSTEAMVQGFTSTSSVVRTDGHATSAADMSSVQASTPESFPASAYTQTPIASTTASSSTGRSSGGGEASATPQATPPPSPPSSPPPPPQGSEAPSSTLTSSTMPSTRAPSSTPRNGKLIPQDLLTMSAKEGGLLLQQLWRDPLRNATVSEQPEAEAHGAAYLLTGRSARLSVPNATSFTEIPASALEGLGETAALVSIFREEDVARLEAAEDLVTSVVQLELHGPAGPHRVQGLAEPILVAIPKTGRSRAGEVCAFWDVAQSAWSFEGLETRLCQDGGLVCVTRHLTLFASILRGFLQTLTCAHLSLLSKEGLRNFADRRWMDRPMALALWLLLASILALFALALELDRKRGQTWSDECFLLIDGAPEAESPGRRCGCLGGGHGTAGQADLKGLAKLANTAVDKFVMASLRRQTSAKLWISSDAVDFICGNPEFQSVIAKRQGGHGAWEKPWHDLHRSVLDCMRAQWQSLDRYCSVPPLAARIFLQAVPLVSVYLFCPFRSCSLRLLLLTTKLLGTLFIGALFFQAGGDFLDKDAADECRPDGSLGAMLGRIIAVAIASLILGALPMFGLNSLHSRRLAKVDCVQGPLWKRQLRKWRLLDALLWALALLYCGFCLFFIMLFVANLHPSDSWTWGSSGVTSMFKDEVLIPLTISVFVPLLALGTLDFAGKASASNDLRFRGRLEQWRLSLEHPESPWPVSSI